MLAGKRLLAAVRDVDPAQLAAEPGGDEVEVTAEVAETLYGGNVQAGPVGIMGFALSNP